jgi:hypothetical protein
MTADPRQFSADAFAAQAHAQGVSTPRLPFPALCMDGQPYTNRFWAVQGDKLFPTAQQAEGERLEAVGTFWAKGGVLEFVDTQGKYHVARDVDANRAALKEAGFKDTARYYAFFCDGVKPSGALAEAFERMLHAPQDAKEAFAQSVRKFDLAAVDTAIAGGVPVAEVTGYMGSPVILDIITSTHTARGAMVQRLLPFSAQATRCDGWTLLHVLASSGSDNSDVMAACIKAGADPLARARHGLPAFLALYPNKPSARAELACLEAGMLRRLPGGKDKVLVQAQCRFISEALEGDNLPEAYTRIGKLKDVWKFAQVLCPQEGSGLPEQVKTLLEPMTGSRADRFKAMLMQYDVSKPQAENEPSREFAARVVLPLAIMEYAKRKGIAVDDSLLFACDPKRNDLLDTLTPLVKTELFGARSLDKIIGLNEAWHDTRSAFPDALQPLKAKGEWHSLTGKKEHALPGGYTLHVHTNAQDLTEKGAQMKNCAGRGGYASRCLDGQSHVFSLAKTGSEAPIALIEGRYVGNQFFIWQNFAAANAMPPEEARRAEEWLEKQVACGAIPLNPERGETEESRRRNPRPKILRSIGFEVTPGDVNRAFHEIVTNERRTARVFNPQSGNFEDGKHQPGIVIGMCNMPQMHEDGTPKLSAKGKPVMEAKAYTGLPAEVWFAASGMQDKAMQAVTPLLDRALEAAQNAEGQRWQARVGEKSGAVMAK